eukprot:12167817-Ditylum_brightwellii.AAC.1
MPVNDVRYTAVIVESPGKKCNILSGDAIISLVIERSGKKDSARRKLSDEDMQYTMINNE